MHSSSSSVARRSPDPFFDPGDFLPGSGSERHNNPPDRIENIIKALEGLVLAQNATVPGIIPACKILHALRMSGLRSIAPSAVVDFDLSEPLSIALEGLAKEGPNARALGEHLANIATNLEWYRGPTGRYASANFEQAHAHAILAGPSSADREGVLLGITVMAPYTRFPDHGQSLPRVMFPLSKAEYKSINGDWVAPDIGAPVVCAAGRSFAMRCTSQPLLALWCQRLTA